MQSIKACTSNIHSIIELDHMTILAISVSGEITLIYSENETILNNQNININIEDEIFTTTAFPTLGCAVTHTAISIHEPDYRFLICTSNGVVTT